MKRKRYAKARTYKEYTELPKKDRTIFGFWYLLPEAAEWSEWKAIETHFKIEYPLQFRIRECMDNVHDTFRLVKHWWYDNVHCRLSPKNKWATKVIPHTWADKTWLIEKFLFECIVHYVEVEAQKYNHLMVSDGDFKDRWDRIQKCYTYIKIDFPKRESRLRDILNILYPSDEELDLSKKDTPEEAALREEYDKVEQSIDKDTKYILKEIVDLKDFLWT